MTARKVAAGIWFVFAFVFAAVFVNDVFEGDVPSLVFGAALAPACAWIGYRLLRGFSRDLGLVAAMVSAFLALFSVAGLVQGNIPPFPGGAIVLALITLAGVIPWRERDRV